MSVTEGQLRVTDPGAEALDGTGIVSDIKDLVRAQGPSSAVPSALATGLSALGAIEDPFAAALSSGVGWAFEHVSFLREPLNALAGNPTAITAHARTWQNIAQQLGRSSGQRADGARGLGEAWQGDAREKYLAAASTQADTILRSALSADDLSREVLGAGAMVGTVRTLIRDLLAKFIAGVMERFVVAMAAGIETGGASIAAFIADMVAEGVILAGTIAGKVAQLVAALGRSSTKVTALAGKLDELAQVQAGIGQAAKAQLPQAARNAVYRATDRGLSMPPEKIQKYAYDPPENVVRSAVTEAGDDVVDGLKDPADFAARRALPEAWKQAATAEATESQWRPL